jgi:hypothetical protein
MVHLMESSTADLMEILKGAPTESSLVHLKEIAKADPKERKKGYLMVS